MSAGLAWDGACHVVVAVIVVIDLMIDAAFEGTPPQALSPIGPAYA